jgi:tetratricopeptide (TPR) repeat protein
MLTIARSGPAWKHVVLARHYQRPVRWIAGITLALVVVLTMGCAAPQTSALLSMPAPDLPAMVELKDTPFFAQEDYQCGPAALATVLQSAAIPVTPESLVSQVYVPARKGSFAPEMLVAARRNGALSVTLAPQLRDLLLEVAAGNPVLVLQNLSLPIYPVWHFAVVIGYDLAHEEIVLRSGTTRRLAMSMSTFEHTWRRSGQWAMVVLPPGRMPKTASESAMADAVVAFERNAAPGPVRLAYSTALQRWPRNLSLQLGAANAAYRAGDREGALTALRGTVQTHPDSVAALNNLASVLAELGRLDEARPIAAKAVSLGGPLQSIATTTLQEIDAKRGAHAGRPGP